MKSPRYTSKARNYGLSILEIMIALTISLVVIGGTIQIYLASAQTYRMQEALSRIQESGRFAAEILRRELRMAEFSGCPPGNPVVNVLNDADTRWWTDYPVNAVRGFAADDEDFPARDVGTAAGDRVTGTEAVILIGGGAQGYALDDDPPHNPNSAQFKLQTTHSLINGMIVMVCDAQQTAILQLTNVNSSNSTIVHNIGNSVAPGNCNKFLGSPDPLDLPDPTAMSYCADAVEYSYGADAMLIDFYPVAYYIGHSQSLDASGNPRTRSLYRSTMTVNGSGTAEMLVEELIENIEEIVIQYGVDTDNTGVVNEFVAVNDVDNWNQVLSLRVDFLIVSEPDRRITQEQQTLMFPIEQVVSGNLVGGVQRTFNDGRLRQAFTTTIAVRNRLP